MENTPQKVSDQSSQQAGYVAGVTTYLTALSKSMSNGWAFRLTRLGNTPFQLSLYIITTIKRTSSHIRPKATDADYLNQM